MRYSESGKKGWWYGDYSALLYGFVRGEEVKGMKKIDAKEMRAVEGGGMWYTTKCGGYSFYTSRWTGAAGWAKAKIHYIFCSQCQINNKLTGWWLRFGR